MWRWASRTEKGENDGNSHQRRKGGCFVISRACNKHFGADVSGGHWSDHTGLGHVVNVLIGIRQAVDFLDPPLARVCLAVANLVHVVDVGWAATDAPSSATWEER